MILSSNVVEIESSSRLCVISPCFLSFFLLKSKFHRTVNFLSDVLPSISIVSHDVNATTFVSYPCKLEEERR